MEYLAFFLVFVACFGVACLPWEALDKVARRLPQRPPNQSE